MSPPLSLVAYRFGPFRLNIADRILERDGERLQLTPKVIDTLFVLVENSGQVVTKEALMQAVWPDVTVVESGLTRNISVLRKALEEDNTAGILYVETIPRRGYRFLAEVSVESAEDAAKEAVEETEVPVPAVPVAPVRRRRRPWIWAGLIAFSVLVPLAMLFLLARRPPAPVDPFVRIGEHLLYKLAPEETIRASEHFERAIAANPNSAGAHAGLAFSLIQLSLFGVRPLSDVLPRAERAAEDAVRLDGRSSTARNALGMIRKFKYWRFDEAEAEFRKALEFDPNSVQTRVAYSRLKSVIGDHAGAQRLIEEALALDPASPPLGGEYCRIFYLARDFRRAESECRKVLDREPGFALAHYYLGLSLGFLGRFEEAHRSLDDSGLREGVLEADRAWLKLREGDSGPAEKVLQTRRDLVRQGTVNAVAKLLLATALGRNDEAFEAIESGLKVRAPELLSLHAEPRLDALRSDPRYADVVRRIGITTGR